MATVTETIGTNSRNHSTITLWEANLDDDPTYDASDIAVGECYDDSVFDELVVINGGGTIGLASVTLSVNSAERHDGTEGTGARIVRTADGIVVKLASAVDMVVDWLEIDSNAQNAKCYELENSDPIETLITKGILHGGLATNNNGQTSMKRSGSGVCRVLNTIIYDWTATAKTPIFGLDFDSASRVSEVLNVTIHGTVNTTDTSVAEGIHFRDAANTKIQNTIVTGTSGTTSGIDYEEAAPSNATVDHNIASDTSASGTGSVDSVTVADQYVSTTGGSEDLHTKSGADTIDAGVDLVTTPTSVNIDINGRDRDAEGDTWDIGAHELVSSGIDIEGSLLTDADIFFDGLVSPTNMFGSLLTDADTLNDGFEVIRQLQEIEASILEDADTLNQGVLGSGRINASLLSDSDTLNHGLITLNIESSLLSDSDTVNDGFVRPLNIVGSILTDTNTFNAGLVRPANLFGSILTDDDIFNDGNVYPAEIFGSILEDADTLNQGVLGNSRITASLLGDTNTFFNGELRPLSINGSLFEDSDNIFNMKIEIIAVYRILTIGDIVGGDIVDLVDEVVLASAT